MFSKFNFVFTLALCTLLSSGAHGQIRKAVTELGKDNKIKLGRSTKEFGPLQVDSWLRRNGRSKQAMQVQRSVGVIGTGGGNLGSGLVQNFIKNVLGGSGAELNSRKFSIKKKLINTIKTIVIVPPKDPLGSEIATQLQEMVRVGLIQDIENTIYRLSDGCYSDGVLKSATTRKVNLATQPKIESPEICINVTQLATLGTREGEVIGLLMHEHSRHFGFEDTNELGVHQFAFAMEAWYKYLSRKTNPLNEDAWGESTFTGSDVIRFNKRLKTVDIFVSASSVELQIHLDSSLFVKDRDLTIGAKSFDGGKINFSVLDPIVIPLTKEANVNYLLPSRRSAELMQAYESARITLPSGMSLPINPGQWAHFYLYQLEYPNLL